jgi:hypothetical protein
LGLELRVPAVHGPLKALALGLLAHLLSLFLQLLFATFPPPFCEFGTLFRKLTSFELEAGSPLLRCEFL